MGGYWINTGLPQYISIDGKPENGCEVQTAGDRDSGMITALELVRTAGHEAANLEGDDRGLPYGCLVFLRLIKTCLNIGRIVVTYSYFASVTAALGLKKVGPRFVGVVKTAT